METRSSIKTPSPGRQRTVTSPPALRARARIPIIPSGPGRAAEIVEDGGARPAAPAPAAEMARRQSQAPQPTQNCAGQPPLSWCSSLLKMVARPLAASKGIGGLADSAF